ncbi:MFS transporter [Pseudodesulfovibrio sp.]|uniref:MFS transporter n=1 Tax=unclassified Pseudodesulfovibrio TaxID=2661612 RepID=UPI003B0100C6
MRVIPLIILCTGFATFMGRLDSNIVGIALPAIADHFSTSAGATAGLMLYYMLAMALLMIPLGAMGDRFGFRRILMAGYGIFTLSSLLCGMSTSLTLLIGARWLQGAGSAMMLISAYSLIPQRLPLERVGKAMGALSSAGSVGILIGAPLGGVLIQWLSWRSIFIINLPAGLIALWLVWRRLPPDAPEQEKAPPFDWPGCLLASASLLLFILGVERLRSLAEVKGSLALLLGGGALLLGFLAWQKRSEHPLIDRNFFHDPLYRRGLIVQGIMYLAIAGHGFSLPFYLDRVLGLSHQNAGLTLTLFPIGVALGSTYAGRLADRLRPSAVLQFGAAGNAFITALFALALHMDATRFIYVYLPVMGIFFGNFLAPSAKMLLAGGDRRQGLATSIFHTVNNVALTFGIAVSALALTMGTGRGHATSHAAAAFLPLYAMLSAICLVAALLAFRNNRKSGRTGIPPAAAANQ